MEYGENKQGKQGTCNFNSAYPKRKSAAIHSVSHKSRRGNKANLCSNHRWISDKNQLVQVP